jgi:hypothetical protein
MRARDGLSTDAARDDARALVRFVRHHGSAPPSVVTPAAAQLVVARELGFASWPRLEAVVEAYVAAGRNLLLPADGVCHSVMVLLAKATSSGGAPDQHQDPVEAEWCGRSWPEGGDGEIGGYGEVAHGGREQDGATSSPVTVDAEETPEQGGGNQETDESERDRKIRTG